MQIKTTLLAATNRFSRYPVVLIVPEEGRPGAGADLARQAVDIQSELGVPGMATIETGLLGNQAGFECILPELARDLMQYVRLVARAMDDGSEYTERSQELATQMSNLWWERVNHNSTQAAIRLGIPWQLVTGQRHPLIALGQGVHRRLFWKTFTPETAEVGVVFSTPKNIMGQMLHDAGLPVPRQALATDFSTAERLAANIGWPVVVKPSRTDRGVAITTGIRDKQELRTAFDIASAHGDVLVQKHIEGDGHRILVHNGRCVAAVRQKAAQVVGDGHSSVSDLIAKTNETRTEHLSRNWKRIQINEVLKQMLDRAGLTLESIPAEGQVVRLRSNTNLSQGGTCERVTDTVHPANRAIAEAAAAVFGIDLAGVDIQTTDISAPLTQTGGAVIEVNSTPAWFMLEEGTSLEDHIVSHFLPEPARGRVPIIVCLEDRPDTANAIAAALSNSNVVALSTTKGVSVDGHQLSLNASAGCARRTHTALANPLTEIAVISVSPQEVLEQGLGIERIALVVGSRGVDQAALRCLDRSSDATVVYAEDLAELLVNRPAYGDLWCVTDDVTRTELKNTTAVAPAGKGVLEVKPAGEPVRKLQIGQLSSSEQIALQVIGLLFDSTVV